MPQSAALAAFNPTAEELAEKRRRIRTLLDTEGLTALLLTQESSVAWVTGGGATRVSLSGGTEASASVLVTQDAVYVLTDAIEAPRIAAEELPEQGVHMKVYPWEQGRVGDRAAIIEEIVGDGTVGADAPAAGLESVRVVRNAVRGLRASLLEAEIARYRWLAQTAATVLEAAARAARPGMTELQIAASYVGPLMAYGIQMPVALVAADERIDRFRHPLPTDTTVQQRVLLVAGATRWGLNASASRAVCFGALPDDLRQKQHACALVDLAFTNATKPGAMAGDIFAAGAKAYADAGFPGEWRLHHQGGAAGYAGREWTIMPGGAEIVQEAQSFAYNPSITGTKSEDTFVLRADGTADFLSVTGQWPAVPDIESPYPRPAILEIT
ncbi:MAG: aminopeptidase P family N-terminal domain-containing protein [Thermomicrobia bacterium]|nr:aminopeptidase P family N-terminal domain-containing protein [Thermomicrobia bacterium]